MNNTTMYIEGNLIDLSSVQRISKKVTNLTVLGKVGVNNILEISFKNGETFEVKFYDDIDKLNFYIKKIIDLHCSFDCTDSYYKEEDYSNEK